MARDFGAQLTRLRPDNMAEARPGGRSTGAPPRKSTSRGRAPGKLHGKKLCDALCSNTSRAPCLRSCQRPCRLPQKRNQPQQHQEANNLRPQKRAVVFSTGTPACRPAQTRSRFLAVIVSIFYAHALQSSCCRTARIRLAIVTTGRAGRGSHRAFPLRGPVTRAAPRAPCGVSAIRRIPVTRVPVRPGVLL